MFLIFVSLISAHRTTEATEAADNHTNTSSTAQDPTIGPSTGLKVRRTQQVVTILHVSLLADTKHSESASMVVSYRRRGLYEANHDSVRLP